MSARSRTLLRAVVAVYVAWVIGTLGPPPAWAQSDNRVAAEELFREARKLLDAGDYRAACEKLAASERLEPAVGTLLNLAGCYEKLGQTASAWATYREAVAAAKRSHQAEREKRARRAADALEASLPRLMITVSPQAADVKPEITRDGIEVSSDLWGVAVPVDPGEHVISVVARGRKPWQARVASEPGATKTIDVPALDPQASSEVSPPPGAASQARPPIVAMATISPPREPAPAEAPHAQSSSWTGQKTLAVVLAGIALGGGAVAVVEGLDYSAKKSEADMACPGACQSPIDHTRAISLLDDARTASTWAIVGGSVGGAAAVAACVLWFTAGDGQSHGSGKVEWAPFVGTAGFGIDAIRAW